jgi:prevent-host-death family protein
MLLDWWSSDRRAFWSVQTLPLSEVKARLSEIADEVDQTHERVYVTRNGRDFVVLMAKEDLDSLEATLELLSDPEALARLAQAERDVAAGEGVTGEQMSGLMRQRRAE